MHRFVLALLAPLLLTGCFMVPGKFAATLDLRSDGTFTYTYDGEIRLLGLAQLAEQTSRNAPREWKPEDQKCWEYDDEDEGEELEAAADTVPNLEIAAEPVRAPKPVAVTTRPSGRPVPDMAPAPPAAPTVMIPRGPRQERECTAEELAERKERFDEAEARRTERRERDAAQAKAMFGGIDPSDPKAGEQIAERLERQYGWNSVEHKGDGLFEVDFSITSRIDHDFAFPVIEGMGTAQPFLYMIRREGNVVRIEAPGFASGASAAPGASGSIFSIAMLAGGFPGSRSSRDREILEALMQAEGTFRIVTDGEILANNTDEGYMEAANGRELAWNIGNGDSKAPMALIRLSR